MSKADCVISRALPDKARRKPNLYKYVGSWSRAVQATFCPVTRLLLGVFTTDPPPELIQDIHIVTETILEIATPCRAEKAGEGIMVTNLGTGLSFTMTESAAAIWRDLTAGHSAESLIRLANGNTSLANSVERFVVELVDAGLVRKSALPMAPARPAELASAIADGSALPPLDSLTA